MQLSPIWNPYLDMGDSEQTYTSKKTSRSQVSRAAKYALSSGMIGADTIVFDLGCGHDDSKHKALVARAGGRYLSCDLYNKSQSHNLSNIHVGLKTKCDVVLLSNVLNVVREQSVRRRILEQAKELLADQGQLIITVFEGSLLASEKSLGLKRAEMKEILTRDGWQNRWKTKAYLNEVAEVFHSVELSRMRGSSGESIIACKNDMTMTTLKSTKI